MPKPILFIRSVAALICLITGLLLWRNLGLHFAEIEEILPALNAAALLQGKLPFLILIGISLILAVWLAARIPWKAILAGLNRPLRIGIAAILFALTFIPLFWLRFGPAAWLLLAFFAILFFLNIVGLLEICALLAPSLKPPPWPLSRSWSRSQPWLPAFLLLGAAVYFSHHCFGNLPHVEDSIAQLLQARIFASGQITADPFQPREFFFFGFMVDSPRWFSQYPPGHPLVLTLGVLAGMPHLINPLLGFVCVVLFYLLLKEMQGHSFAIWGAWLMALSPFVLFMSSEFMNSSTALAASLLGWLALKKGEFGKSGWLVLAGLSFGYCAITRPLEGAIFALIGGLLLLSTFGFRSIGGWIKTVPYALAFLLMTSLYFAYNALTTGDPFKTGYALTWGGTGFGLGAVNWGPAHTFGYGLVNTFMSIGGLNVYLWEIPIPALLAVFLWAIFGGALSRWDKAFLTALILVPAGYLFYYFHDFCFGPRYYYVIVPQLIFFSVKGVSALYSRLAESLPAPAEVVRRGFMIAFVFLLAAQLFAALPYRASVYADSYWGTDNGPMKEARRLELKNAIIFIENHPWEILMTRLHSLGFIMGDAHRFLFLITQKGLDEILADSGIQGEEMWNARADLRDLEQRIYAWNREYLRAGNSPVDPWAEEGYYTYFSSGAVHLDPRDRNPGIILARDLGEHNHVLMQMHPDREAYRYAWDEETRRFQIKPIN